MCQCLFAIGFWWGSATPAAAQQETSAIRGQIVDRATRTPIARGAVLAVGTNFLATSDSAGRFELAGLSAGKYELQVRAAGYTMASQSVALSGGEWHEQLFEMDLLRYDLPEVVARGKPPRVTRRFADFESRRAHGVGHFITLQEIESRSAGTLVDILRTVRGVRAACNGAGCTVQMARAPSGCEPQYFVDGFATTTFGGANTPPLDIQGIEVYRGASETPAEFITTESACGVISIWTKSAP